MANEENKNHFENVILRRRLLEDTHGLDIKNVPFSGYDYDAIYNKCCENVVGYVTVPLGVAGPILVNNTSRMIPLATTEGALVASINRGCKAIRESGGVNVCILTHGITRAPMFGFPALSDAISFVNWCEHSGYSELKKAFESTTRYGKVSAIHPTLFGKDVILRVSAETSDAMGMNMVTKGVHCMTKLIAEIFPSSRLITLSSNACTDKKASAQNWINGRGRRVVGMATIPRCIVRSVLKTTPESLVVLNQKKCFKGSAIAGLLGGNNYHTANIVAAIYLATGQDIAQIGTSSASLTEMEYDKEKSELVVTCTLPSLEIGTIGGGTGLEPQSTCIQIATQDLLGSPTPIPPKDPKDATIHLSSRVSSACANTTSNCSSTTKNAPGLLYTSSSGITEISSPTDKLAETICAAVIAGELSLAAAQCSGSLLDAHMALNRAK